LPAVGGSTLVLVMAWLRRSRRRERGRRARAAHPAGKGRAQQPETPTAR
jgi:hypothetical protein